MGRFKPDPDFQLTISRAVLGVEGRGRGSVRRRRSTLQEVADQIIAEAKDIVDDEEYGLPSVQKGGRRAKGYDFRSEDRKGKTYRASFRSEVRREDGRLVIYVINDHEHSQDVEFGNGRGSIRANGGYLRLPITMAAYHRIKRQKDANRAEPTEFSKARARAKARLRYWEARPKEDQRLRRNLKLVARRAEAGRKTRLSIKQIAARAERINAFEPDRRRARVRSEIAAAKAEVAATELALKDPHSFVAIGDNGKPYLFTKEVRTYRGYGILRRAMRRAVRQNLE